LSVLLWYHWAFFAISLAMLGVGAPGVWLAWKPKASRHLEAALGLAAVLMPLGVVAVTSSSRRFGVDAIVFCLLALLPAMLALGFGICALLVESPGERLGRRYAADLFGACAAALAVIPLLNNAPTPQLAAGVGALPLLALWLCRPSRARLLGVLASLVLLAAVLAHPAPWRIRASKAYTESGDATPLFEKWTATARLTVFANTFWSDDPRQARGWGIGAAPLPATLPEQRWLEQDGAAGTPITAFDGNYDNLTYLHHDVTAAGLLVRPPRSVAIIGAGGGRDILAAKLAGAHDVLAIELNPGTVGLMRGPLAAFAGNVYDLAGVEGVVGEGRSVLTHRQEQFDVLQISLIDSWAATAAGAYALSENALYTREAYRLWWSRLKPNGVLSTSRWMLGGFGMEIPRLLVLVGAQLRAEGVDPARHVALLRGGAVGNLLVSRSPWSPAEVARLESIASTYGFDLLLAPGLEPPPRFKTLPALLAGSVSAAGEDLDLSPPTDDRPFFFQVLSPLRPLEYEVVRANGINAEGVLALRRLALATAGLTALLFFAPFLGSGLLRHSPDFWRGSAFFTTIGIAFLLVEIPWLQRSILYLGHPSRATATALGAVLLGAGIGAAWSSRLGLEQARRIALATAPYLAATSLALGPIFAATIGANLLVRVAVVIALFAPAGLLMGLHFPSGMLRFGAVDRAWFWALNGAAGVFAATASVALAIEFGFTRVALLGCGLYAIASWLLAAGARRPPTLGGGVPAGGQAQTKIS
jgi:SAM-dependent methyltransferase